MDVTTKAPMSSTDHYNKIFNIFLAGTHIANLYDFWSRRIWLEFLEFFVSWIEPMACNNFDSWGEGKMNETKCQGWKKCILLKGGGVITRGLKQVQLCVISEVHDTDYNIIYKQYF